MAFVRPYRGRLLLALTAILSHSLLGLAGPHTLQFPIGAVFQQNDPELLKRITAVLIAIRALQLWAR